MIHLRSPDSAPSNSQSHYSLVLRLLIAFLNASLLLAEIRISFLPLQIPVLSHTLDAQLMTAIDSVTAAHDQRHDGGSLCARKNLDWWN
ncbi:hypothetical protein C8R45DRAFT_567332 [Mycena sanguinolenta]|nr:hypothetical protein C8R45DRAFT_567332 [Mycena sanguinolenta]